MSTEDEKKTRQLDKEAQENLKKVNGKIQKDNKHFHVPGEKY